MEIKAYIYHKQAEKYSDCQDYFEISSQNNRIAVSDGMSQSIYPQWWAEILAKSYIQNGKIPAGDVLTSCQNEWQKRVNDEVQRREDNGMNPWRLKNAIAEKSGAGATLCGFTCGADKWTCECIGDSCLILIKNDFSLKIHTSQEGAFDNNPDYLDSYTTGRGELKHFKGSYDGAELMLVATDPFTELFQKHASEPEFIKQLTEQLRQLSTHESFVELVERWRTEYQMHNDDSTIVIIDSCDTPATLTIRHSDDISTLVREKDSKNTVEHSIASTPQKTNSQNEEFQKAKENFKQAAEELRPFKESDKKFPKWLKGIVQSLFSQEKE
jgi:hypothetical protein